MNQKGEQKKWRRSGERKKKDKMEKGRNWGENSWRNYRSGGAGEEKGQKDQGKVKGTK